MSDRLKIGQEVLIHGYVDEIRKDTIIIQNEGGYFGTVECKVTDIEMPSTNKILSKIWLEIKAMPTDYCGGYIGLDKQKVLQIIDNHINGKEQE